MPLRPGRHPDRLSLLTAVICLALAPASRAYASGEPSRDCRSAQFAYDSGATRRDSVNQPAIVGVVRSAVFGTTVPGARIDIVELGAGVCSDSAGEYRLAGLAAGALTVRVTRAGFDTLSLELTVPATGTIRVDVALSPKLVVLDSVHVKASRPAPVTLALRNGQDDGDAWIWQGDPQSSIASTSEPDVVRALSGDPHLAQRPDWPGGLLDRGGASDQLLVRVDGLPVWSPLHGSGTMSAISPDVVDGFAMHDGAVPARFGDRLGGELDIDTRPAPVLASTGAASLGPAAVRAAWGGPLTIGNSVGGIRFAFRHSNDDVPSMAGDAGPTRDRWADGLATIDMTTGRDSWRVVMLASSDRAALDGGLPTMATSRATSVPWSTGTLGLVWNRRLGTDAELESHISTSRFGVTLGAPDSGGLSVGDGVRQTELASELTWRSTIVGVSIAALNVSYRVAEQNFTSSATFNSGSLSLAPPTPLALVSAPTLINAYVEHVWGPADSAWHVVAGTRAMGLVGTAARLEPRLAAAVRLFPGVVGTIGYARLHQTVQSLRNAESALGTEIGVDLPVAAGASGVPLAQADVGTIGAIVQLGPLGRLSVDGYVRALSGLAVADPRQWSLFATTAFDRASARVSGLAAQMDGGRGILTWQASYGVGRTIQSTEGLTYHPTSELGQVGSAAVGIALDTRTQVRAVGWAAVGQRAPGLDGPVTSHDDDIGASSGGLTDHGLMAPWVSSTQLPPYLRADIQVLHQWQTGPWAGRLSMYATLANVFNHANVAGLVPTSTGTALRGITLLPRTVLLGVEWAY